MNDINDKKSEVNLTRDFIIRWVVISSLAILFAVLYTPVCDSGRRPPNPMPRAPGTLRAQGSSQLAYAANHQGMYATFDGMIDNSFIARSYTLANIVENYSVTWDVHNISTVRSDIPWSENPNQFTIICWPTSPNRRALSTFGITEDQVVRVFTPENGNDIEDVESWDPIP